MSLIDQAIQHYNEVNANHERENLESEQKKHRDEADQVVALLKDRLKIEAIPNYTDGTASAEGLVFIVNRPEYGYHRTLFVQVSCPECQEKGWIECNDLYSLGSIASDGFKLDPMRHECQAGQAQREQRQANQEEADERRRQRLLAQVMLDPVGFRLVQVFSEVLRERAEWHDQLSGANDCLQEMEESYGARLSRAEQSARDARRDVEEANRREVEAQEEAASAMRKLKQIERER